MHVRLFSTHRKIRKLAARTFIQSKTLKALAANLRVGFSHKWKRGLITTSFPVGRGFYLNFFLLIYKPFGYPLQVNRQCFAKLDIFFVHAGITLGLHLFMILLTVMLLVSGYDILPIDFGGLPLDLPEDATKLRTDAWLFATEDDEISPMSGGQLERGVQYQSIQLIYEGDNVFSKESLNTIKNNEEKLFNETDYQNKLCQLTQTRPGGNRTCKRPLSILRFFDGSYRGISEVFNDPHFDNISGVLYAAKRNNLSKALLNYHLGG
jgi:hypothetical protein